MVKDAFWLARKEIQYNIAAIGLCILITFIFAVFIAFNLENSIYNILSQELANDKFLFIDVMFLLVTPVLASIFMAAPYLSFRTIKEDPFNKRMALYRSLPIL